MDFNQSAWKKIAKSVLLGGVIGVVVTAILLALLAATYTASDLSEGAALPLGLSAVATGALVGGFFSTKLFNKNGLLYGSLTGLFMFLILFAISLLSSSDDFTIATLLKLIFSVLPGAIGGVIGVNFKKQKSII